MLAYFLILVSLVLVNGLFAMAELALFSSRATRLSELAKGGSRGARAALRLLEDPTRFLSTAQFYITLIGVGMGVYSGARFAKPLAVWLAKLDALAPIVQYLDTAAYFLVVVAVTYLSLVIGELVPKRWALTNPEAIASRLAPLMEAFAIVSKPFVWVLAGLDRAGVEASRHPHDDEPRRERGGNPLDDRRGDAYRDFPRRRAPDDRGRAAASGPHGAQHHDRRAATSSGSTPATAARRCGTPSARAGTRAIRSAAASSTSCSAS